MEIHCRVCCLDRQHMGMNGTFSQRCLKKVSGRSSLNYEELRSLLPEIQSVVNALPLIYVFDDQEGIYYPLTPAQLIYRWNLTTCNDKHFEVFSTLNKALTKHANYHRYY